MIARAETSNAQHPQGEKSASKGMNVALIGPNDTHRQIVARALASSQGRKVHEFIDYPNQLRDLPQMFEQNFDFVLVDVDTDESYALQIIEKLSEIGQSVMAYSARSDQELLMACMRAGARDFLPLPTENDNKAGSPEPSKAEPPVAKQAVAAPPIAARPEPAPMPDPPAARSNVTTLIPEKNIESVPQPWSTRTSEEYRDPEIARVIEEVSVSSPEASTADKAPSEFAAWDAANLRRAPLPPPPGKKTESRPRPSLVPERRNPEPTPRPIPSFEKPPTPAIERPPVAVELFRSSTILSDSEPDEAAEKQGANWVKWILIAAGPLVLALVLLVVFTRSSSPNSPANAGKGSATPAAEQDDALDTANSSAKSSAKPVAGSTTTAKPAPGAADTPTTTTTPESNQHAPVSSEAMAAQLVAPTRIAGQIKKVATADEPPPTAPSAVSMDDSSAVPGAVFGGASKVKMEPHVVAISAGVADGMIVRKTPPVYPKFAQEAHITGKVVLKATITKQGTIEGVQVLSGPKILAPSAVDAVKTWKYRPYMLDGQPVSVETNITIVFGSASR